MSTPVLMSRGGHITYPPLLTLILIDRHWVLIHHVLIIKNNEILKRHETRKVLPVYEKSMVSYTIPGRPEVATGLPLIGTGFTLQNIKVLKSVTLLLHFCQAY